MFIALDSRDLIALEGAAGERQAAELADLLHRTSSTLVMSVEVLDEVTEPLRRRARQSRVMQLVNRIEALPYVWVRTADLEAREVQRAIECYNGGRDYEPVSPLVSSFVDTIIDLREDSRDYYRRRPLAEIVWELAYAEQRYLLRRGPSVRDVYPSILERDRALMQRSSSREYRAAFEGKFRSKVADLAKRGHVEPQDALDSFTGHVWNHPAWCPAARLAFASWAVLAYDASARPRDSDLEDLVRLQAVPYVDVFTCDKAMRSRLRRLRQSERYGMRGWDYWQRCRIARDLEGVVQILRDHTRATSLGPSACRGATPPARSRFRGRP